MHLLGRLCMDLSRTYEHRYRCEADAVKKARAWGYTFSWTASQLEWVYPDCKKFKFSDWLV